MAIMVDIPTAAATVIMVDIPTMTPGHPRPTPTVTSPITRKTYRCTVTATTTPSATRRRRKKGWTKMHEDRHKRLWSLGQAIVNTGPDIGSNFPPNSTLKVY